MKVIVIDHNGVESVGVYSGPATKLRLGDYVKIEVSNENSGDTPIDVTGVIVEICE